MLYESFFTIWFQNLQKNIIVIFCTFYLFPHQAMGISKNESTKTAISPTTTLSNHQKEAILNAKTTKGSAKMTTSNWPSPSAPSLRAPPPLPIYPCFDHSSASLASSSTHSPAAVPQFHTFPREMRQLPPKRPPPPQQLLRADTLPNTLSNPTNAAIASAKLLPQLKHSARMACCFCCCPVYRCVLWFCAFELICSIYFWYSQLSDLMRTYSNAELKDVLGLLILSGWLVTLAVSTASILIAHRKGDPQWVLPRLVQQSGLLILGFMMALILVIYFAGGAQAINNWLITIYEGLYSDPIPRETRQGVQEDLRFYFLLSIVFTFCFICYISSALCATKKYYRELQITGGGRPFQPVSQMAPPPQPPVNPYYKGSYA